MVWKTILVLALLAVLDLSDATIVPVSECAGYASPAGCTKGVNCAFEASWHVYEAQDPKGITAPTVTFTVTLRRAVEKAANFYTALGFSEHQAMPDTDVAIGYVYNNNFLEVVDAFIEPGRIQAPVIDPQQDVVNYNGSLIDDPSDRSRRVFTFTFTRKLDTGDTVKDISLSECRYLFFVAGGGTVAGPRNFYKHDVTPDMSADKICLTKCIGAHTSGSASGYGGTWIFLIVSLVLALVVRL